MNGPGLRIEEAVGGRVKKGRTKMQVEMIVGTEMMIVLFIVLARNKLRIP